MKEYREQQTKEVTDMEKTRFRLPRKEKKRMKKWSKADNLICDKEGYLYYKYYSKNR